MKKAEKPLFVDNLTEELKSAKTVVVVDYSGLSVKAQQTLKKRLKNVGARLVIIKNSLFRLASKKAGVSELSDERFLAGPSAIVITEDDPISPIQILSAFAKEFEIPRLKVGLVDGRFQDEGQLAFLASLPSREILLSQTVGAIASPIYSLVGTLQSNLQKLVYILNTKAQEMR